MMKLWKRLRGLGLGWLMVLVLLFAGAFGLAGCGQVEVDAELVGQVVSVAADIAMEELLETETQDIESEVQETRTEAEVWNSATEETTIEETKTKETTEELETAALQLAEDGWYTDKEQVALYIHLYGKLPGNFIDKYEAEDLGWESSKGNLDKVAPGKSIGGNKFGNREGLLPKEKGRTYYECDINYEGGYRGGERIVYSNDGLVYYTGDHYESFELLYTKEGTAQ